MRVLVACEFTGAVRNAITRNGHYAVSCDLIASETPGRHVKGNVLDIIHDEWDAMICFPPCTYVANCGNRWMSDARRDKRRAALLFMRELLTADIPEICMENPVGGFSTYWRKPDQIIQPWQFGHGETKTTCLWLKSLPLLSYTNIVSGREPVIHTMAPGPDRGKDRSRTYPGIAQAMADQWFPRDRKA